MMDINGDRHDSSPFKIHHFSKGNFWTAILEGKASDVGAIEIMDKKRNPMFFAIGVGFATIYLYSDPKNGFSNWLKNRKWSFLDHFSISSSLCILYGLYGN